METFLILPAFIAGVLTFFAPCTFPLLPAYISFIGGTSVEEIEKGGAVRKKVFLNGLFYVLGFSFIFVLFGSLFGLGGGVLFKYRGLLSKIGGALIIVFGLFMTGLLNLKILNYQKHFPFPKALKPGTPISSFAFGATFAFGWTPCIGPILGSILALAAASSTVGQGAFLLGIFSLGLAIPFLLIAAGGGWALSYVKKFNRYLQVISIVGGILLIILGLLLITRQLTSVIAYSYKIFSLFHYEKLLKYY